MTTAAWDHDAFYKNVIARAKALGVANSTAELARAVGVSHAMLSKWYRGHERPSPRSLQKLSDALTLPTERAEGRSAYTEFMVLAGHLKAHEVGLAEVPAPPPVVERDPLVAELDQLLGDRSQLGADDKAMLRGFVDRAIAGFRTGRNGKRSA
ncbi:helix-turn-helix domain-containing protein [Micromonospora aurantiaca]|uniref:helix-turn-helix domain-containing protein n=1 Tax=Micromonospora aurantiaca (nom. illeg.) TaxID=47850 RepID=UPI0013C2A329|nr:helix-turn-helix transcriptional regulator [Micromonospora aurantiaca]